MPLQSRSDSGARVLVTKEMEDVVVREGDDVVTVPPPTCPICLDPLSCAGGHRICCIPCGHVYGRSCLERWLDRSALNSAKCPQCGEQFEGHVIINLYAPENLWDGCLQDFNAYYKAAMKQREGYYLSVVTEYMEKTKLELDKMETEFRERMTRVKERMRNMAEEENATPKDLVEFLELSFPQPSDCVSDPDPAPVDSENNARRCENHPCPADAVRRSRRRGA